MLKKHTKHTGHTEPQLDYHYKTADFKKSKGEKNLFEKSQDSRRVLVYPFYRIGYPLVVFQPHNWSNPREYLARIPLKPPVLFAGKPGPNTDQHHG